jgi:hypothetical protein
MLCVLSRNRGRYTSCAGRWSVRRLSSIHVHNSNSDSKGTDNNCCTTQSVRPKTVENNESLPLRRPNDGIVLVRVRGGMVNGSS